MSFLLHGEARPLSSQCVPFQLDLALGWSRERKMIKSSRYAIVTPYYNEQRSVLERCVMTVKGQTVSADHFLVADGIPQDWLDQAGVRHIKLDQPHRDYGDRKSTRL